MRNRMYGGVRGRKTKVGRKLLRFPPTRLCHGGGNLKQGVSENILESVLQSNGEEKRGFPEENQRSFGLLPSNFVSLQNGIEVWCNGSTTDFGSACPSSNLGTSTFLREVRHH